jgi:hypothetical protein
VQAALTLTLSPSALTPTLSQGERGENAGLPVEEGEQGRQTIAAFFRRDVAGADPKELPVAKKRDFTHRCAAGQLVNERGLSHAACPRHQHVPAGGSKEALRGFPDQAVELRADGSAVGVAHGWSDQLGASGYGEVARREDSQGEAEFHLGIFRRPFIGFA